MTTPPPSPAEEERVLRLGRRTVLARIREGSPDRVPLLMCCGIGASQEALQPVVDTLDAAIPVVRFDVPGVGRSPTPALPYTFQQIGCLADALMRRLGHSRYDVLGYSWGGGLAQQIAWQHRARVRRLVLLATGTGAMMVPGRPEVLATMLSPRRFRDASYAAGIAARLYGGSARQHSDDVGGLYRHLHGGSRRGYAYQLLAGAVWTSLPWLPTIAQRTLILAGDDDPIIPLVNARIMATLIPRARLHVYRGGHLDPLLEPDRIVPAISDFLS
ncbi:alpha/beta fold hydrolase [Nocardioides sp.]|uniref:alpha/beta fold hydrolase n=1 Tax=Nocardioides sp. TaxID=35761 RepID=UPI0039E33CAC